MRSHGWLSFGYGKEDKRGALMVGLDMGRWKDAKMQREIDFTIKRGFNKSCDTVLDDRN